ncbi:UEV-domain-containing protein [Phellopilus nigrolimitatus]|nr:UEV-domain-containing protein [Phellopilus nigrolimitatus]
MSRDLTANWLRQNSSRYRSQDRLYADVLAALDHHPSLRPKSDVYTYDDGRTQLLLCIHGLLPISFRNSSYNIPVALWLTLPYPAEPPLVYVIPTSDMLVKPSPSVDLSGRCNIDYTSDWSRKPDACSLAALIGAMQAHFSREPPLYAKPRPKQQLSPAPPAASSTSTPSSIAAPRPGAAPSAVSPDRDHVPQSSQAPHAPRLPPKPYTPGASNQSAGIAAPPGRVAASTPNFSSAPSDSQLHPSSSGPPPSHPQTPALVPAYSSYASYAIATDGRANHTPPVPPHPTGPSPYHDAISSPAPGPSSGKFQSHIHGPPPYASAHPSVPTRPPVPPPPFAHGGHQQGTSHMQLPLSTGSPPPPPIRANTQSHATPPLQAQYSGSSLTPAPPATPGYVHTSAYYQSPGPPAPPAVYSPLQGAPTRPPPSIPPPDLLDQDDGPVPPAGPSLSGTGSVSTAPPPPRPPNPQTVALHNALLASMRDSLSRLAASHADALTRQRAQQAELLAGPGALRDESARLAAVRDVCRAVSARWGAVVNEGERVLGEVRRHGEVGVDEMVCASSIVGNQLINLVAEDNAIEDTMYHLHRALNSGRIDLERFLRTTRVLAEEQFMKRALVEKIVRGLPMGMSLG